MITPLYWIEGPWPGRLAIAPRPRGGEWLADEVHAWRQANVSGVVSALTADETEALELSAEPDACRKEGLWFANWPIADRDVPESRSGTLAELKRWDERLHQGESVLIHCRQGIGRSALLAASLLMLEGLAPTEAWSRIEQARRVPVPDTPEQKAWATGLAKAIILN